MRSIEILDSNWKISYKPDMRADRLISLLMLLQLNGRMTAEELSERLEVSPRTIYRDLDALSASGVPVYAERGPQGGCMLMESYRTNLTGLNEEEVKALFMFSVPGLLAELGADKASEAAMLKLTASLPAPFQKDAQRVQERLLLDPAGWFQGDESVPHLPLLQEAVWNDKRVRIHYRRGDGQWVKRLIEPLGLVAKAHIWYVVCGGYGGVMVYRASRIMEAALSDSTFSRPADFNLAAYWQAWRDGFEEKQSQFPVQLRIFPGHEVEVSQYFGDSIIPLIEDADPEGTTGAVTITLTFDSETAACHRLMGLGTAVEIIAPDSLRTEISRTAIKMAQLYSQPRQP